MRIGSHRILKRKRGFLGRMLRIYPNLEAGYYVAVYSEEKARVGWESCK